MVFGKVCYRDGDV